MRRFFSKLTYKAGILILALAIVIVGSSFVEKQFNVSPQLSRLAGDVAGAIFVSGKFLTPTITNAQITSPYQQVDGTVYMSGNVGIGTASPAVTGLHINNPNNANTYLRLTNATTGTTGFDLAVDTGSTAFLIQRNNAGMVFRTNNVDRMTINAGGTISIPGTVTAPTFSGNLSGNAASATTATTAITATSANTLRGVGSSGPHGAGYYHIGTWGGGYTSQGSILVNGAKYAETAGAAYPYRVGGVVMNMNWSGQGGQPPWLWGGSDGTNMYVYNPSNFNVNYANSAGSATNFNTGAGAYSEGAYVKASYGMRLGEIWSNGGLYRNGGWMVLGVDANQGWAFVAANVTKAYIDQNGTYQQSSDRTKKENFTQLNKQDILTKINQLPITLWNFKGTDPSIKHVGPMAQDFHSIFGLGGNDDKTISSIDPQGITLVGIQALSQKIENQQKEIDYLKQEIEKLKAK